MVGEHGRVEGAAMRDEDDLLEVLAQDVSGEDVEEGSRSTTVKGAEGLIEQHEAGSCVEFAWEDGNAEGEAQGQGKGVCCSSREGRFGYVFAGSSIPDADLEGADAAGGGCSCLGACFVA